MIRSSLSTTRPKQRDGSELVGEGITQCDGDGDIGVGEEQEEVGLLVDSEQG